MSLYVHVSKSPICPLVRLLRRVQFCPTADDFYSTMGHLTQEMLEQELVHPADLMQVKWRTLNVFCVSPLFL